MGNSKIRCFLFGAIIMLLFVSIKTQAQNLENGKKIYQTKCLVCHQSDGGWRSKYECTLGWGKQCSW